MAATKVRQLVANKDYTHSLTIKLAKSLSSHSETSFQCFRNDSLAKDIPEKAFRPFQVSDCLLLGRLKLESPQRREQFTKVLHSLDWSKLIGPAPASAQLSSVARDNIDAACSSSHVAPLRINLSGLITNSSDLSHTTRLYLRSVDPTGRLHPFWRSLIDVFAMAGFPIIRPTPEPRMMIVNMYQLNWHISTPRIVLPNGSRRYRKKRPILTFDATELLKKYANETWATDVRLERLSLRAVGATERNPDGVKVFKDSPEVDSVVLP